MLAHVTQESHGRFALVLLRGLASGSCWAATRGVVVLRCGTRSRNRGKSYGHRWDHGSVFGVRVHAASVVLHWSSRRKGSYCQVSTRVRCEAAGLHHQ